MTAIVYCSGSFAQCDLFAGIILWVSGPGSSENEEICLLFRRVIRDNCSLVILTFHADDCLILAPGHISVWQTSLHVPS